MIRFQPLTALAFTLALGTTPALASETREIAGLTGPAAPVGLSIEELGALALGREYADNELVASRALRARKLVLEPGGVVPIHSHVDRPAVTYIVAGDVIEHRSDTDEARRHGPGAVTLDGDGMSQWWENAGDEPVIFFVVDFFNTGSTPDH